MFETDANSVLWGLSPTFLVVGGVYHLISIAAPYWLASPEAHVGLWKYCPVGGDCVAIWDKFSTADYPWLRTVQGLQAAATVFVVSGLVSGLLRVNLGFSLCQTVSGLCACLGGCLGLVGISTFKRHQDDFPDQTLSWAYIFNITSSVLSLVAGPLLCIDSMLHKNH